MIDSIFTYVFVAFLVGLLSVVATIGFAQDDFATSCSNWGVWQTRIVKITCSVERAKP